MNVLLYFYMLLMNNKWMDKLKALSTLSQKSATVAEKGETTATVALFCDSVDRL